MSGDDLRAASKFLSFVLRHDPGAHDLQMDAAGWVEIDQIVERAPSELALTRELIGEVAATNDKQRFAISDDRRSIRANQGHSIAVDVGLVATQPPTSLFHGTAQRFLDAILSEGLSPQQRQHVHLTADHTTAVATASRHGKPVVLQIDAASMHADGIVFYLSQNGVWLVDAVAPRYLGVTAG